MSSVYYFLRIHPSLCLMPMSYDQEDPSILSDRPNEHDYEHDHGDEDHYNSYDEESDDK